MNHTTISATTRRLSAVAAALILLTPLALRAQADAAGRAPVPSAHPALPAGHKPIAADPVDISQFPTATGADLEWKAPAALLPKPNLPLRVASYRFVADGAEADLAISAFPGTTGGLEANLNRWRGQVGLAPLEEEALRNTITPMTVDGIQLVLVDYAGTSTRLIGAVVPHRDGTWFFKLTGSPALLEKAKPVFLELIGTIRAKPAKTDAPAVK